MLVPALIPYNGQIRVAFRYSTQEKGSSWHQITSQLDPEHGGPPVPSTKAFQEPSAGTEGSCL